VAVAVSPGNNDNNGVFVTGSSGCLGLEHYVTVAYNATTGVELWTRRYDGPTHDPDEASALAVSPDGKKIFVTRRSFGQIGEGRDFATVAYSASMDKHYGSAGMMVPPTVRTNQMMRPTA
jgi:hypothetical protein